MVDNERKLLNSLLMKFDKKELKQIARKYKLKVGGTKPVLSNRIIDAYEDSLIEYQEKSEKIRNKYPIVNDIKKFTSNVYDNDIRLSKLIKNIITSKDILMEVSELLSLNLDDKVNHNDSDVLIKILNTLKEDSIKKEAFFRQFYKEEIEIETLENKYLNLYFHFFTFYKDEILKGLKTGLAIKDDWIGKWDRSGKGSSFAVGAERVIYALINGKGIGQPNSSPVGADLFFETEDAYIHIDLKTISTGNIGDFTTDIPVGNNQTSYNGLINVKGEMREYESGNIPKYYTVNGEKKISLTYFVTILYDKDSFEIIQIMFLSMPNGALYHIYESDILVAGKSHFEKTDPRRDTHANTIRYNWSQSVHFETLPQEKRVKVIYSNEDRKEEFIKDIPLIYSIYSSQKN